MNHAYSPIVVDQGDADILGVYRIIKMLVDHAAH
jgi:hypothetical protein